MAKTKSMALRFTHVSLENWRNFAKVDIDLQRRGFLVGPNASGKSNLLDVFRFLRELVSVGGGFQEAVRKRGGVSSVSVRCLSARRYSDILVRICIGSDENLLDGGLSLADAVMPRTRPKNAEQLRLFGD